MVEVEVMEVVVVVTEVVVEVADLRVRGVFIMVECCDLFFLWRPQEEFQKEKTRSSRPISFTEVVPMEVGRIPGWSHVLDVLAGVACHTVEIYKRFGGFLRPTPAGGKGKKRARPACPRLRRMAPMGVGRILQWSHALDGVACRGDGGDLIRFGESCVHFLLQCIFFFRKKNHN